MSEERFLSLQHSESVIANMASRIFAAYVQKGEVGDANADEYVEKSVRMALRIAVRADAVSKSDGEWIVANSSTGPASLL
ncbi:MAG: hypothetical protein U1C96_09790 [Gallionella sp.]|nr:hypothetical protein [Gallionella sp.]